VTGPSGEVTESVPPRAGEQRHGDQRPAGPSARLLAWARQRDPGLLAIKKAARAAIVLPASFALSEALFHTEQLSLFTAFGGMALLLFVEFPGRPRTRCAAYLVLAGVGAAFVVAGTLASTHKVVAVASMAVVAFAVLFAGVAVPQISAGSTSALLAFVLSVSVAAPTSEIGNRLAGWGIACLASIPAIFLLWPRPWHDDLRLRLASTIRAVARLAGARADTAIADDAVVAARDEVAALGVHFATTPYPLVGAAGRDAALATLVGRVEWAAANAGLRAGPRSDSQDLATLHREVARTLEQSADVLSDGTGHPVENATTMAALAASARQLNATMRQLRHADIADMIASAKTREDAGIDGLPAGGEVRPGEDIDLCELDPMFHARTLAIATGMVAEATLVAAGAKPVDELPGTVDSGAHRVWSRLATHLSLQSLWCRNALRGAVGLAIAVGVVEATDVSHGFWVVLGTLSVLRSNALGTGLTALHAVAGTLVGFVIGTALMIGIGDHHGVLWVLLPLAVFAAGAAPSLASFTAGQTGFTVTVIIIFNLLVLTGWRVGLARLEDVIIGSLVSVVVGLLFWPRGATAALGRALAEAFVASSGYLGDAVRRITTASHEVDTSTGQMMATAAFLRLDDEFRQLLTERGAKRVPIATVSHLCNGSNQIRLAAYTLASLPPVDFDEALGPLESTVAAGALLRDAAAMTHRWYEQLAECMDSADASAPPAPDEDPDDETLVLRRGLMAAFGDALSAGRADLVQRVLRMLWADEILCEQRSIQTELAAEAGHFPRPLLRAARRSL
jgi:hypothetical protein